MINSEENFDVEVGSKRVLISSILSAVIHSNRNYFV